MGPSKESETSVDPAINSLLDQVDEDEEVKQEPETENVDTDSTVAEDKVTEINELKFQLEKALQQLKEKDDIIERSERARTGKIDVLMQQYTDISEKYEDLKDILQ